MSASKREAPHFYLATEIEMDALLDATAAHNVGRDPDRRVTVTAFLVRAVALASPSTIQRRLGRRHARVDGGHRRHRRARDGHCCFSLRRDVVDLLPAQSSYDPGGNLRLAEISDATFTVSNPGCSP
jgi:pyruvate dehydrogenase E2 component (dihydrolipoamide acetyltransferase)